MNDRAYLAGELCYLRPLEASDAEGPWARWLNDAEVRRNLFRGVFPPSVEEQRAFYESVVTSRNDVVLAIVRASDDRHVGVVGIHRIDWVNRSGEFGILIGEREAWGGGIGTEATRLIVAHAFHVLNLHRVWLGVLAGHEAAVRAYQRVGFREEGRLREELLRDGERHDKLIMGLLAHEFAG
jgi:RimJ/RimL family protein N-acetyltransferase